MPKSFCLMRLMAAPRQVGSAAHQLARGDYCRLTTSRTKPAIMRFMRSAIAPRRIGSADRRMTRGEYRRMTMCHTKPRFMHDAVDGGSRIFGCGDDSTDPRQLSLRNDVLHKVAFLCVNAVDCSPRAFECGWQSILQEADNYAMML